MHIFPDRVTKLLPGEPLTFTVSIEHPEPGLHLEIWTDLVCRENKARHAEFAIPLVRESEQNGIVIYQRTVHPSACGFYGFTLRYRTDERWRWFGEDGSYERRSRTPLHVEPSWSASTIVYNAFVRQFGAKDPDHDGVVRPGEGGTFQDLIDKMDYFVKLGIGAIYLNPIQMTGEVFHYDERLRKHYQDETNHLPLHLHPGSVYTIKEYKSIDPELGLNARLPETDQYHEFRRFVAAAHACGIRIILDMVFDHTARDSFLQRLHPEWFLYKKNPHSLEGPYVLYGETDAAKYWGRPEHVFSPYDHSIFWTDCAQLNWNYTFAPAENAPPLNPRIDEMREYFKSVLKYWITHYGVDGFRLDVAYAIPSEFWHEAVEESRAFAERICRTHRRLRALQPLAPLSPDILFIGETYVDKVCELQECGLSLINGDFSSKLFTVEQLKGYLDYAYNLSGDFFPRGSRWLQFPECHDFERLPEKFKNVLKHEGSDVALNKSRWVLAALLPGTPMLHNGYEVVERRNVSVRSYTPINWESPKNIVSYLAKVNTARREHVCFQKGSYQFVPSEQGATASAQLFSFVREYHAKGVHETALVIVNMDINEKANHVRVRLPQIAGRDFSKPFVLHDLLSSKRYERSAYELTIVLDPGESHVFLIEQ